MRITIGELISEILPFSKSIDVSMVGDFPILKASIGNKKGFTVSYLYIMQVKENQYSVCETADELHGNGYIVEPSTTHPFIKEKEFIRRRSGKPERKGDKNDIVYVSKNEFIKYFLELLKGHKLIKVPRNILEMPLSKMDFQSKKISKQLSILCKIKEYDSCVVQDIIFMMKKIDGIHLKNFKKDEIQDICKKFKQYGILLDVIDNTITSILLEPKGGM